MPILHSTVSPKQPTALRLDTELLAAMRQVKERDGIPITTQIEKAVGEWLAKRGAIKKTGRKRVATRKRP